LSITPSQNFTKTLSINVTLGKHCAHYLSYISIKKIQIMDGFAPSAIKAPDLVKLLRFLKEPYMKAKPSEIKKMAALLEEEAESSEEMAKKVWELVEELTAKRDQYMAVAVYPSLKMAIAVGPYNTVNNLRKDYGKHIGHVGDDCYGIIATVRDPSAQ